jgi:hypothetical protein
MANTPSSNPARGGQDKGTPERSRKPNAGGTATQEESGTSKISQTVQDTARQAGQKAQEVAAGAMERATETMSTVGEKMTSLAGNIREQAPQGGMVGGTAAAVADGLEAGSRYFQDQGLQQMADDLSGVVRRYPMMTVLTCIGVGWCLGALMCRR